MDPKYYYIGFKTKSGDGTNSSMNVQLYDIDGHAISDAFEVTQILHDTHDDSLSEGTYQVGIFPIPLPGSFKGLPEVYFLSVTMLGSDSWSCEYIEAVPVPAGRYQDGGNWTQSQLNDVAKKITGLDAPRFTFDQTLSTDASEGPTTQELARDGYKPQTKGDPTEDERSMFSYDITNNIGGSSTIKSNGEEVKKIRQNNVSLSQGTGDSKDNSISVGVTVGYTPPSVSGGMNASFSTTYTHSWGTWHSSQQVQELLDTTSHTYTFPPSDVPANTLRIARLSVDYTVTVISVSNGVDAPATVELIAKQGLDNIESDIFDINADNAKDQWATVKARTLKGDPHLSKNLDTFEAQMKEHKWL